MVSKQNTQATISTVVSIEILYGMLKWKKHFFWMPDLQNQNLEMREANTISTMICATCCQNSANIINQIISLKDWLITSAATESRQSGVTSC